MKTHVREGLALQQDGCCFLFCSNDSRVGAQLAQALGDAALLTQELPEPQELARRLAHINPRLVFLDFTPDEAQPGKLLQAADLARTLARVAPGLPRVAVGSLSQPEGAVAALRAGVSDFVDPASAAHEVRDVVERVMEQAVSLTAPSGAQRSALVLSARPGVGASTLAVHLAALMQKRLTERAVARGARGVDDLALNHRVALLDLGWPAGDCQLYLNTQSDFDFVEAVKNLRRLDHTLLASAMASSRDGIGVLALPRELERMRSVSRADSLMLFERLREHYGLLLVDAGGFSNMEFVAGMARTAQQVWLVTDQSVGALVSMAALIRDLQSHEVALGSLYLVVNRYDERYGMTAGQIAERFGIALAGVVPDRTRALMSCINQGQLLHEQAERDPYVRAVQALVDKIDAMSPSPGARPGWLPSWLAGAYRRLAVM